MDEKVIEFLNEVFEALPSFLSSCPIRIFNADSLESLRIEIYAGDFLTLEGLKSLSELPYVDLQSKEGSILVTVYSALHIPY